MESVYYDPYDVGITADPYPVYRRMREEAPLYYNPALDFFALSRFEDVERALHDPATFISGRGGILELIRANIELPPGVFIFEDPPAHTIHRRLMSRVFTRAGWPNWRTRSGRSAPSASTRWSEAIVSTSSPTSGPKSR